MWCVCGCGVGARQPQALGTSHAVRGHAALHAVSQPSNMGCGRSSPARVKGPEPMAKAGVVVEATAPGTESLKFSRAADWLSHTPIRAPTAADARTRRRTRTLLHAHKHTFKTHPC